VETVHHEGNQVTHIYLKVATKNNVYVCVHVTLSLCSGVL